MGKRGLQLLDVGAERGITVRGFVLALGRGYFSRMVGQTCQPDRRSRRNRAKMPNKIVVQMNHDLVKNRKLTNHIIFEMFGSQLNPQFVGQQYYKNFITENVETNPYEISENAPETENIEPSKKRLSRMLCIQEDLLLQRSNLNKSYRIGIG